MLHFDCPECLKFSHYVSDLYFVVSGGRESSKFSFEHIWDRGIAPISHQGEAANRSMYFSGFLFPLFKS